MQPIRGTKDILPDEITNWQNIYCKALEILSLANYYEIRTPLMESTSLFTRGIGNNTDIVNKEMYNFTDAGNRKITLRPEGTASIARAFISNKLYQKQQINRLWYMGPMFRYERPQSGRQRQFHQLGIECIGSPNAIADAEVIKIANQILSEFSCNDYTIHINSIGTKEERYLYIKDLVEYIKVYKEDIDPDSQRRLTINPLRIMDSKNSKTQAILENAPCINTYLNNESLEHFMLLREHLDTLKIPYFINHKLVRGLDYYNNTAFEITSNQLGSQNTICGGGRYNNLIQELGGPSTPAVGWAMGIERLLLTINNNKNNSRPLIYIVAQGKNAQQHVWYLINLLEKGKIRFNLDLSNNSIQKQIKKANQLEAIACLILGERELNDNIITIKWLFEKSQEIVNYENIIYILKQKINIFNSNKTRA